MPDFTGERFVPGAIGEIAYEHWHRYAFARRFAAGRRVLDAACGEGYGTALLGAVAAGATGVDIDAAVVARARAAYGDRHQVSFATGSVTALPFAAGSFDVVVSFETIEHLDAREQPPMLAEFRRVLAPGGLLVLSSPNKRRYSDERSHRNPFHRHELYRDDLAHLLEPEFPYRLWFHQQPSHASAIWREGVAGDLDTCEAWSGGPDGVGPMTASDGVYHIVAAAATPGALPQSAPRVSLYADRDDTELARAQSNAAEVIRLDRLLGDRDAALRRQAAHVAHLEQLVAERERIVVERDAQLAAVNAARESFEHELAASRVARDSLGQELTASRRVQDEAGALAAQRERELAEARRALASLQGEQRDLEAALAAQERIIRYQHGLRWWLHLPWLRLKRGWQRWRGN